MAYSASRYSGRLRMTMATRSPGRQAELVTQPGGRSGGPCGERAPVGVDAIALGQRRVVRSQATVTLHPHREVHRRRSARSVCGRSSSSQAFARWTQLGGHAAGRADRPTPTGRERRGTAVQRRSASVVLLDRHGSSCALRNAGRRCAGTAARGSDTTSPSRSWPHGWPARRRTSRRSSSAPPRCARPHGPSRWHAPGRRPTDRGARWRVLGARAGSTCPSRPGWRTAGRSHRRRG